VLLRLCGFEIVGLVVAFGFCQKGNQRIVVLNRANVDGIFVAKRVIYFVTGCSFSTLSFFSR
jgi:hypothetical protein